MTERIPAFLIHCIFSSVQLKEPGLRNQSCVFPYRQGTFDIFRSPYLLAVCISRHLSEMDCQVL